MLKVVEITVKFVSNSLMCESSSNVSGGCIGRDWVPGKRNALAAFDKFESD